MFTLRVPKQTLFFAGPQRCGKSTAMLETIAAISRNAGILVIAQQNNLHWIKKELDARSWATHKNIICQGIESNWPINLDEFSTVALMESSIHSEQGQIELYVQPSSRIVELFEHKLPACHYPVYVETHLGYVETLTSVATDPVSLFG